VFFFNFLPIEGWRGQGESNLFSVLQTGTTGLKPEWRQAPLPPVNGSKRHMRQAERDFENED